MVTKETAALLEKFEQCVNSEVNENRKKYWLSEDNEFFNIERWRGRPARKENTTFTMSLDMSGYSPMLGIDCGKYYTDPEENLKQQLRYGIWDFENIPSGRYFEKSVFCSMASVFDASLFGAQIEFLPSQPPWYDERNPMLANKADLLKIKPFNFETSGLIPNVREMYEHHAKAVEGTTLKALFPTISRSPFSVAVMLRGFQNVLFDLIEDTDFFEDLMATITGTFKEYAKARKEYLGEDSYPGVLLGNDEIATPVLSPGLYEDYIYPYEEELAKFHGSVRYWHSCGVTQHFYEQVAKLPNLKLMHIGPWSDIEKAVKVFGEKDISIEICRNDVRDMYEKNYDEKVADLQHIKDLCEGKVRYQIRMDGIAAMSTIDDMLDKVNEWQRAAKFVFGDPAVQ